MHPRHQTSRARIAAAKPAAALAFAALDSLVLIALSGALALFGLWR